MYAKDGSDMTNKPMMPAMPLSLVKAGETVKVSRVKGGDDMKRHLNDIGFVEGNEIHVVSSSGANIIVTILGSALWLGHQSCPTRYDCRCLAYPSTFRSEILGGRMHAGGKILVREGDMQIASTSIRKGDANENSGKTSRWARAPRS